MMEHNTDRLFWTLVSIIIGALIMIISVKAFPRVASTIDTTLYGHTQQADISAKTSEQAYKDAVNNVNNPQQTQDSSQQSLHFAGDTKTGHLADVTTSGIYNLAGKEYDDLPSQYGLSHAWGQLVIMNTGWVCTQTLYTNMGTVYNRTINSWGVTAWRPIGQ